MSSQDNVFASYASAVGYTPSPKHQSFSSNYPAGNSSFHSLHFTSSYNSMTSSSTHTPSNGRFSSSKSIRSYGRPPTSIYTRSLSSDYYNKKQRVGITVGRGGAGNNLRTVNLDIDFVDEAELLRKRRAKNLLNPRAKVSTTGRGGAGNIKASLMAVPFDPSTDPDDNYEQIVLIEAQRQKINKSVITGRGGSGNCTRSRANSFSSTMSKSKGKIAQHQQPPVPSIHTSLFFRNPEYHELTTFPVTPTSASSYRSPVSLKGPMSPGSVVSLPSKVSRVKKWRWWEFVSRLGIKRRPAPSTGLHSAAPDIGLHARSTTRAAPFPDPQRRAPNVDMRAPEPADTVASRAVEEDRKTIHFPDMQRRAPNVDTHAPEPADTVASRAVEEDRTPTPTRSRILSQDGSFGMHPLSDALPDVVAQQTALDTEAKRLDARRRGIRVEPEKRDQHVSSDVGEERWYQYERDNGASFLEF
ncbi:hypothetical protein BU17DRAFT_86094 [Hysterangium stoloniferum]|nr:hypothetical protein BU17DRAFT_86094 [Hysterangium stoloniferum]